MSAAGLLDRGRADFTRRAWRDAYNHFSAADRGAALDPEDLEQLATAAYLVGEDAGAIDAWARGCEEFLGRGDAQRAARCGFWVTLLLLLRGDLAQSNGWLARAQRWLDDGRECPERGYLLIPVALQQLGGGDAAGSYATHSQVTKLGERFEEPDLVVLGRLGQGEAMIDMGETPEGITLLDEVMVEVTSGRTSPVVTGIAYCAVILYCRRVYDLRRAHEWTAALSDWCATQPDLVPFRGQCLVHRSELMQLRGDWADAMVEAQRACERLTDPPGQAALGMAFYQRAELHRLRGDFVDAEHAYREAGRLGRDPHPGLALLRLSEGEVDAAAAAIHRVAEEAADSATRASTLGPYVEIMLEARDVAAARAAAEELSAVAADLDSPFLRAHAAHAIGSVLLAEGDPGKALEVLRGALAAWQGLVASYEAARTRVLTGLACREVGDRDTGDFELSAARRVFAGLGAAPDLGRVDGLLQPSAPATVAGLTGREREVLALAAAGETNRAIATTLVISEKTVERHLSNIFTKLGVANRAAATSHAYERGLL